MAYFMLKRVQCQYLWRKFVNLPLSVVLGPPPGRYRIGSVLFVNTILLPMDEWLPAKVLRL